MANREGGAQDLRRYKQRKRIFDSGLNISLSGKGTIRIKMNFIIVSRSHNCLIFTRAILAVTRNRNGQAPVLSLSLQLTSAIDGMDFL